MIQAAIFGRLGNDPVERQTRGGKTMVTASVAINAGRADVGDATIWLSLAAFGRPAEALARHVKGDLLGAMGRLYHVRYTTRDGTERTGLSLTVEAIVSARNVRPSGGRKRTESAKPAPAGAPADDGAPFNDPIPW